ncbi:MAG: hypothetical protein JWM42_3005, partial [Burkholderia sp.]|nr:hypothetical protein [Burkholderia sp.]
RARNRNAHHVVAALTQTPGETQDRAAGLTYGRHAIPNSVYAKLVAIPGIYAGDDELSLYSSLPIHQDKTFVVVDQDGTLLAWQSTSGTTGPISGCAR